jgi:hypothetical protein
MNRLNDNDRMQRPWTVSTRRERIATAVLAGFAAEAGYAFDAESMAKVSLAWADALIAEMDKEE